jgi:putative FmdB family regulatory protein
MPIYEYKCENCSTVTEKMEPMSGSVDDIACPSCGGPAKKIISGSAFHLKGGGWYATDYKNKPQACSSKSDSPSCAGCPAAQGK